MSSFSVKEISKNGKVKYSSRCKQCHCEYERERYQMKKAFIEERKTKCLKCGESRKYVLDFHHIDPSTKSFTIGRIKKSSLEAIENEIDKCIVLCANCHREFHHINEEYGVSLEDYLNQKIEMKDFLSDEELDEVREEIKKHKTSLMNKSYLQDIKNGTLEKAFQDDFSDKNLIKSSTRNQINHCANCGKTISYSAIRCVECSNKARRIVERPSKEQLFVDICSKPIISVAEQYGVSDNTIRKWCRHYGLPYKRTDIARIKEQFPPLI